jgi:SpoVK/Ycf46/Vps4 family AAA+-type ATPase
MDEEKVIKRGREKSKKTLKIRKRRKKKHKMLPPVINNIRDLIEVGRFGNQYSNIDNKMLSNILPQLMEIDRLVGMYKLKESIFYQIIFYLQKLHLRGTGEYLHTVITGPPGCGKTSVSRLIGEMYKNMGILSKNGIFRIAKREDMIAQYLGQTAIKTKKLLKECIGGCLLIDEAYALGPGKKDRDSFSKEALDTLNAFLSEHKSDFCCILAGYEDDIESCVFSMNKGLKRRFPWVHAIENYSSQNLTEIFLKMIKDIKWETIVPKSEITDLINNKLRLFKYSGGDIETFLSKCKMVHSKRIFSLEEYHRYILTRTDLKNALEIMEKNRINDSEPPPFMYT